VSGRFDAWASAEIENAAANSPLSEVAAYRREQRIRGMAGDEGGK
jgi:hypothetical protein